MTQGVSLVYLFLFSCFLCFCFGYYRGSMDFFNGDYKNAETKPLTIEAFEEYRKLMLEAKQKIEPICDLLPPPNKFDEGDIVVGQHYVWVIKTANGRKQWAQAPPEVIAVIAEIFRG